MRIKILIRLKNQILEPQGKVIEQSLKSLGFEEFSNIRQGKLIEIDLPESLNEEERSGKIDAACKFKCKTSCHSTISNNRKNSFTIFKKLACFIKTKRSAY